MSSHVYTSTIAEDKQNIYNSHVFSSHALMNKNCWPIGKQVFQTVLPTNALSR